MLLNCAKCPVAECYLTRQILEFKPDRCCDAAVDEVAVAGAVVVDGEDRFAELDCPVHRVHGAGVFFAGYYDDFIGNGHLQLGSGNQPGWVCFCPFGIFRDYHSTFLENGKFEVSVLFGVCLVKTGRDYCYRNASGLNVTLMRRREKMGFRQLLPKQGEGLHH